MANSFLDGNEFGATQSAAAPDAPTVGGLPQLGAYSTGIQLKKPEDILPNLVGQSFNIPSINVDMSSIVNDVADSVEDFELPSYDTVEEKAEEEGIDPVEWVDENVIKPIDQNLVRPIDQGIEDYVVDPVIDKIIKPVGTAVGDFFTGINTNYLDPTFSKFTTPKFIKDLEAMGGEFIGAAEGINNFKKNPNSATAAEFLNSIDKIYGTATGQGAAQLKLPEFELIEGAGGVTGDQTIEGSRLFNAETIKNVQDVAGMYNIVNYIDNPTVEGSAAVYGDLLHLSKDYAPEVYNALGSDTAANVVGELANIVKVFDAVQALEGGIDGIGEALTVTSGISAGASAAVSLNLAAETGIANTIGGLAGPLAIASLAHMAYQLTKDQDFPRSFASIEYDPEHTYQSGYYGYFDEDNPSGNSIYAINESIGKNFGGYGPFKYGEGRSIDGGDRTKTDSSLMASQEFANWMVTGLGYEVDEAAFKKFAEDGSNFVGDGDIGYLQARHGYKGIKKDGYELTVDMINKGVFVKTENTVRLDPEDWNASLTHLKEAQSNPDSFLYRKLADISDPVQFAPDELKQEMQVVKERSEQMQKNYDERQKLSEENPELAKELRAKEIKDTLVKSVVDAGGSLQEKISAVEAIMAADDTAVVNISAFNAPENFAKSLNLVHSSAYGIVEDPYTRFQESRIVGGTSPFGFYGTLPYIG